MHQRLEWFHLVLNVSGARWRFNCAEKLHEELIYVAPSGFSPLMLVNQ